MKTEEDEAFDDLARKQGMWGGGFQAKRQMAADKLLEDATRSCNNIDEQRALDALMRKAQPAQEQEEDWGALAEKQLASIKRDTRASFEGAMVRAMHKVMAKFEAQPAQEPDALTIAYQSGFYDGKKAALAGREWNFCERCGKRTADLTVIHTCTPPQDGA